MARPVSPEQTGPEQIGPWVPWPHVADEETPIEGAFNPQRKERAALDHQADCQEKNLQAR